MYVHAPMSAWLVLLTRQGPESLSLPSSTFISAAIGYIFQGLQLFACRGVWYGKFRKDAFQNSHFGPCSDFDGSRCCSHTVTNIKTFTLIFSAFKKIKCCVVTFLARIKYLSEATEGKKDLI